MIPSTQALLAAAASAVSAASVRLLDLSEAVKHTRPTQKLARQTLYTLGLAAMALREARPLVQMLAKR